jgi:hypothetical protein
MVLDYKLLLATVPSDKTRQLSDANVNKLLRGWLLVGPFYSIGQNASTFYDMQVAASVI